MKSKLNTTWHLATALLMIMAIFSCPPVTQAQFLKKLNKGLEKVNKTIKKVEQSANDLNNNINRDKEKEKKKKQEEVKPASENKDRKSASASSGKQQNQQPTGTWLKPDKSKKDKNGTVVHLTWDTRFINKNVSYNALSPVTEGIFYLTGPNRKVDPYAHFFGFWTIEGKCLFPQQYEQMEGDNLYNKPRFDNGACVVKEGGVKGNAPIILYADGTTKPLSRDWLKVTQFVDGVAMVMEKAANGDNRFFYINTKAGKIWPHLNDTYTVAEMLKAKKYAGVRIRPVRDNRRAYFDISLKKWGFLDGKGNVVIKAQYDDVRDFANGYALVIKKLPDYKYYNAFIDRDGKEVVLLNTNASSLQYAPVSDICDGIYAVTENQRTTYYDLQGKELAKMGGGGTGFYDRRAFARTSLGAETVYVFNTDFIPVGVVEADTRSLSTDRVTFADFPWYTVDEKTAVNNDGKREVYVPGSWEYTCYLGQYSPDGFAPAQIECPDNRNNKLNYVGYTDTEGRLRVVFSTQPQAQGPFEELPGPQPDKPKRPQPEPYLIGGDTIPQGPVGPGREALKYHVSVVAQPAEGGKVYGTGDYSLGDTIRVTGTAAEGYRISHISSDRYGTATPTFNKFVVKGDMTVTCYFVKKDTVKPLDNHSFAGVMPGSGGIAKAYLQTGSVNGNKFTDSQGVISVVTVDGNSPELAASSDDQYAGSSAKVFFVPMNVLGTMEENGKRYLRFDGGVIQYSLSARDNTAMGILNNPLLSLMLAFDGADRGELQPGSYRVEITSGSPEEDKMTLGAMQRKSAKYGWISADDPSFVKKIPGFFIQRADKGLGADYLRGAVLTVTKPITIQWEPSEGFFSDRGRLQSFVNGLGNLYRRKVKDTPLEDYDMRQFSSDLDNHLFKCK